MVSWNWLLVAFMLGFFARPYCDALCAVIRNAWDASHKEK